MQIQVAEKIECFRSIRDAALKLSSVPLTRNFLETTPDLNLPCNYSKGSWLFIFQLISKWFSPRRVANANDIFKWCLFVCHMFNVCFTPKIQTTTIFLKFEIPTKYNCWSKVCLRQWEPVFRLCARGVVGFAEKTHLANSQAV